MKGAFGDTAVFRTSIPVGITVVIGCLATVYALRKGAQYFSEKLQRKRDEHHREHCKPTSSPLQCYVCNAQLDAENSASSVRCAGCEHDICQTKRCAIWLEEPLGIWNCKLCHSFMRGSQTACDWFMQKINQRLVRADAATEAGDGASQRRVELKWNESDETLVVPIEQRDVVREYIEKLVASMVGGDANLDRVPIGQLYSNLNYLRLFSLYHLRLSRIFHSLEKSIHLELCLPQSHRSVATAPDESYENLKRLVEQIIEQVFKIPELLDYSGVPKTTQTAAPEFDPKKYEELLATAVLNRIVEKFEREQQKLRDRRNDQENPNGWASKPLLGTQSSDCSSDEPRSDSSCSGIQRRPMSINVESSKQNFNNAPDSSAVPHSPTSDEEYLSDYIQNHRVPLPHLGAEDCALQQNPDEEFQSLETNGHAAVDGGGGEEGDESWQNNWMFRKREQSDNDLTSVSNSSIGMLVPSPTEEVKALIGDRTADEVSDLSEAGTDGESELSDAEDDLLQKNHVDIPHVIVESKTLIGGKNEVESFHQTLLLPDVSLVTEPTPVASNVDVKPVESDGVAEVQTKITDDTADVQNSLQTLDDIVSKAEATLVEPISEKHAPIIVDVVHKSVEEEHVQTSTSAEVSVPVPAPRKLSMPKQEEPVAETAIQNCSLDPIIATIPRTESFDTVSFETFKHQLFVEIPNTAPHYTSSYGHTQMDVSTELQQATSPPLPSLQTHPLFMKHISIDHNVLTANLRNILALGTPSPPPPPSISTLQPQPQPQAHNAEHLPILLAPSEHQHHPLTLSNPPLSVCAPVPLLAADDDIGAEAVSNSNLDSLSEAETSVGSVVEKDAVLVGATATEDLIETVELQAQELVQSIVDTIEKEDVLNVIGATNNKNVAPVTIDVDVKELPEKAVEVEVKTLKDSIVDTTQNGDVLNATGDVDATEITEIAIDLKPETQTSPIVNAVEGKVKSSSEIPLTEEHSSVASAVDPTTEIVVQIPIIEDKVETAEHTIVNVSASDFTVGPNSEIAVQNDDEKFDEIVANLEKKEPSAQETIAVKNAVETIQTDLSVEHKSSNLIDSEDIEIVAEPTIETASINSSNVTSSTPDAPIKPETESITTDFEPETTLEKKPFANQEEEFKVQNDSEKIDDIVSTLEKNESSVQEPIVNDNVVKAVQSDSSVEHKSSSLIDSQNIEIVSEETESIPTDLKPGEENVVQVDQGVIETKDPINIQEETLIIPELSKVQVEQEFKINDREMPGAIELIINVSSIEDVISPPLVTDEKIEPSIVSEEKPEPTSFVDPPSTTTIESEVSSVLLIESTPEEYVCKVEPTEYDISVDEAIKACPNSVQHLDEDTLIDQILPDENSIDEASVPKAILISTKPAMVALDLANNFENDANIVIVESVPETKIPSDENTSTIDRAIVECSIAALVAIDVNVPAADDNHNISLDVSESGDISAATKLPESPIKIIVSESSEQAVDQKPFRLLVKQSSLEIPRIDSRENFEDLMKPPPSNVGESVSNDSSDNDDADFVVVTDAEVAALKFEEDSAGSQSPVIEIAVEPTDSVTIASTDPLLSNTTNITNTPTPTTESTSEPITENNPITPTISDVEIRKPEGLYIGSIAEREHQKWENVPDVPGNPYSAEALQKRLSTQSLPRDGDLARLASASPSNEDGFGVVAAPEESPIASPVSKPDIYRYGRDYYINDAKHAAGKTPGTADDWLPLSPATPPPHAAGKNFPDDYELHTATPIFVADASQPDSVQRTTSSEDLSSLPLSSLTPSEGSDTTRVYNLTDRQTSLLQHDIIRCSRLPAREPTAMLTPPSSPIDTTLEHRQSTKHYLSERSASFQQLAQFKRAIEKNNLPISVTVKPLNGAQQYFGSAKSSTTNATSVAIPKKTSSASMEITEGSAGEEVQAQQTVAETEVEAPVADEATLEAADVEVVEIAAAEVQPSVTQEMEVDESYQQLSYNDAVIVSKTVIEEEVLPALPSVKALARSFINLQTTVDETPINRPKSLNWVTNTSHETSTADENPARRPSQEIAFPPYNQGYHPMAHQGHSITARSLSSKFRDELKGSDTTESRGRTSPERPLSPVLTRGLLKNNIAFYENLNK